MIRSCKFVYFPDWIDIARIEAEEQDKRQGIISQKNYTIATRRPNTLFHHIFMWGSVLNVCVQDHWIINQYLTHINVKMLSFSLLMNVTLLDFLFIFTIMNVTIFHWCLENNDSSDYNFQNILFFWKKYVFFFGKNS